MGIAIRQLRPGVADSDYRPAVESCVAQALGAEPRASGEVFVLVSMEPSVAAEGFGSRMNEQT